MEVVIRADASIDIGTGHIMRCLTLANALRRRGATCRFVCREFRGNLLDLIRREGYESHALPFDVDRHERKRELAKSVSPHGAWLGIGWAEDADQTIAALGDQVIDWLIIDHYAIDSRWELGVRASCKRIMVIDDLADRRHECNLLLDQNIGRNTIDYEGLVDPDCTVLAGTKYALLRPEFVEMRPHSIARRAKPKLRRLLITMGGADKDNVTGKVLDALRLSQLPIDCLITVVMGGHAPWLESVRNQAGRLRWNTEVLAGVSNMAELMADCDLAIGAAGTAALERCYLGLPTLTAVLAENQERGANALYSAGAVSLLDTGSGMAHRLERQLALYSQPEEMAKMQQACCGIIDGSGTSRVVEVLTDEWC